MRNLIISVVGDFSCHRHWIKNKNREFDLMLIYYGASRDKYKEDADYYLQTSGMFKLENIANAVSYYRDAVDTYDAIWLPDDDMTIDTSSINRLFRVFYKYDLRLAQPTILCGKISHSITKTKPGYILRYTNFVEMGCPVFKTQFLYEVLPMFTLNRSGWGIDYLWSIRCKEKKMAMIDCVPILHRIHSPLKSTEHANYYTRLKEKGVDCFKEKDAIVSQYGLSCSTEEYGGIKLPYLKSWLVKLKWFFRRYGYILFNKLRILCGGVGKNHFFAKCLSLAQLTANTWRFEFLRLIKPKINGSKPYFKNDLSVPGLISILIPILGQNTQPASLRREHFSALKRLLCRDLPKQTYKNYEAIVYCDGPDKEAKSLIGSLHDPRVKVYTLEKQVSLTGHPQTRKGIMLAEGHFFVRINCDNRPYPEYLQTLVSGFDGETGVVYARVIFKGKARKIHRNVFLGAFEGIPNQLKAFVIPRDKHGALKHGNIDCMNFMVKTSLAKKYVNAWNDKFAADWVFIEHLLREGIKFKFIDRLIADKF